MEKNTCKILLTIEDGEVEGRTHVEVIDTVNCDCFDVSGVIEDFDLDQSNRGNVIHVFLVEDENERVHPEIMSDCTVSNYIGLDKESNIIVDEED